jgi:hypothetical protein
MKILLLANLHWTLTPLEQKSFENHPGAALIFLAVVLNFQTRSKFLRRV